MIYGTNIRKNEFKGKCIVTFVDILGFGRMLIVSLLILFPILVMAQASGGQIKRKPTPTVRSSQNKKGNDGNLYAKTGVHNGYNYVDLGLSVRWATFNVGANSPEGYGSYFAWGETSPRTDYGSVTQNSIRRDLGNNISGSAYDAAHANWGGNWRIPTRNEIQELIDNCKWKQARYNGTDGFCITGPNNKSIFIPAAGYYSEKERHPGFFIKLWTATAELDNQYNMCWVYHLHLQNNKYQSPPVQPELIRESYYVGMCIRPVIN